MRNLTGFAIAWAIVALGACSPEGQSAGDGCAVTASHEFLFSNSATPDVAEAISTGPSCNQAAVVLVLRNANGDLLWTHAGGFNDMVYGGAPAASEDPANEDDMQRFLDAWSDISLSRTSALPPWAEGAEGPGGDGLPFTYSTSLERDAYEGLRAGNGTQACFAADAETTRCLVIDAQTRIPDLIVEYGP